MHHSDLLLPLAQALPAHDLYVELGVQAATTFTRLAPLFKSAFGVDVHPMPIASAAQKVMSTGHFFATHSAGLRGRADLLFIDADHREAEVLADFEGALGMVKPLTGLIVLHDTYPANAGELGDEYCSSAWKAALRLRAHADVECVTIPSPVLHGLTICRYVPGGWHLAWMDDGPNDRGATK